MSIYKQKVVLIPFELTGLNDKASFEDNVGNPRNQSLTDQNYLTSGNASIVPADLVEEFAVVMNAAASALGLTGVFSAARTDEGHCSLIRTGGASPADDLIVFWASGNLPKEFLGFDSDITTRVSNVINISDNLMDFQWMPGKPEVHSDPDLAQIIASEDLSVEGRPSRVVHSPGVFFRREIIWERLFAARMIQSRADEAAFADAADFPVGDDTTWETLRDYLVGPPGVFNDNRVYVLQTNVSPVVADLTGPYEVVLEESTPGLAGVETSSFVQSMAAEQFDVSLMFWREA